jgi:adenine-specific DNA-methyltransferase
MEEVFGGNFLNEIIWRRSTSHSDAGKFGQVHDTIYWFAKAGKPKWTPQYQPYSNEYIKRYFRFAEPDGRRYWKEDATGAGSGPPRRFGERVIAPPANRHWRWTQENIDKLWAQGRFVLTSSGKPEFKRYLDEQEGEPLGDVWDDVKRINMMADERIGYATQKPEVLLDRIVKAASSPGDLVADLFCGSGTTLAVAEKLGRRWIGADLGRFAIHTTRKRLLDIPGCKPFEVLNLGKYERQYWQGVTTGRDDSAYVKLMLQLYRGEPIADGTLIHGLKAGIAVHVGPIDSVVTLDEVAAAAEGARELGYKRLHVLGWDWQMGLKETAVDQALARGVQLSLKRIPLEIMDPRARERGDVEFFEMNHVDAAAELRGRTVQVFLEDFVIADLELVKPEIQDRIEKFSDYIDYWAVDFDYRDDTFHNQWQSFRTRKQPRLELESVAHTYDGAGDRELLVKVIDIFGNDTTKLLRVSVP